VLVKDLGAPVTAAKVDWLPGDSPDGAKWMGFTPLGMSPAAIAQCQSTIARQANGGYILEYITQTFGKPNPGFDHDPHLQADRAKHADLAGRLIAIHRLHPIAEKAVHIVGAQEYEYFQRVWAKEEKRYRWAVAFELSKVMSLSKNPALTKCSMRNLCSTGETIHLGLCGHLTIAIAMPLPNWS
jgi:5-methylcytosine-specific restriction enzyme A